MANAKDIIIRVGNFICAALYLAMSIFRLYYTRDQTYLQNLLSIYFILFTTLIVLSELKIGVVLKFCNFVDTPFKQGCFFLFCSILCFDIDEDFIQHYIKFSYSVGIITMLYAHFIFSLLIISENMNKNDTKSKTGNNNAQPLPKISE